MIDHFLDIYSKLLIGVISFIAPVTSYLLSTYLMDRNRILARLQIQKETTDQLLDQDIRDSEQKGLGTTDKIRNANFTLTQRESEIEKQVELLNFLNPKRRITFLFGALIISVSALMINALIRGNVFGWYSHDNSVRSLILSCIFFVVALFFLWQIAWKLIDAKEIITKETAEINKANQPSTVQQEIKLEPESESTESIPVEAKVNK